MKKQTDHNAVLGVYVTPETIEAVLLRQGDGHVDVVQRFLRQRATQNELVASKDLALALPGLKSSDDADYTLEVGDGSASGADSFLPSEFGGFSSKTSKGTKEAAAAAAASIATHGRPFAAQLKDILQECHALGYEHPDVAFCIAPPDVAYVELPFPSDDESKEKPASGAVTAADRKRLLTVLPQHFSGPVDEDRVAFLPLSAQQDRRRFLALVADPAEPVAPTLAALRQQQSAIAPSARLLDAEPSLYASLLAHSLSNVDRSLAPQPGERTAIVRIGVDDTLVLFFDGTDLSVAERLRSLTSFDAPDTVCSRILLQQDEKRIGDLHNVIVVSAGRDDRLLNAFRGYYPDAAVESMQRVLADCGVRLPEEEDGFLRAGTVPAIGIGLRRLEDWDTESNVNLLPRTLRKRSRRKIGFAWHTALALLILIGVSAFTYLRYDAKAEEIEAEREVQRLNPIPPPVMDPDVLQFRVDSLDAAYATYTRALDVLDSLLVGSDKWVSTFERVSRATQSVPQTWVTSFTPQGDFSANLVGYSLSRLAIVDLSRKLSGAIEQMTYQDIGERRVYNYQMVIPIPSEMPRAALYLRNVQEGVAEPEGPLEVHPAQHDH